eukprot:TRINITY_DN5431_c0_g1_i1.p1 TRINITY_DN5431_c0_g1~~TRINITY_DN5431_c0_g1_i1.p1  ORF type:complete len:1368 (-),score=525.60 TRINITY_DN5431_c0_g1_i1:31-4089(-)
MIRSASHSVGSVTGSGKVLSPSPLRRQLFPLQSTSSKEEPIKSEWNSSSTGEKNNESKGEETEDSIIISDSASAPVASVSSPSLSSDSSATGKEIAPPSPSSSRKSKQSVRQSITRDSIPLIPILPSNEDDKEKKPPEPFSRYLIEHLFKSENRDEIYWFLLCYRKWASSEALLSIWVEHFRMILASQNLQNDMDMGNSLSSQGAKQQQIRDQNYRAFEAKKERASNFLIFWFQNFDTFDFPKSQRRKAILDDVVELGIPKINEFKLCILRNTGRNTKGGIADSPRGSKGFLHSPPRLGTITSSPLSSPDSKGENRQGSPRPNTPIEPQGSFSSFKRMIGWNSSSINMTKGRKSALQDEPSSTSKTTSSFFKFGSRSSTKMNVEMKEEENTVKDSPKKNSSKSSTRLSSMITSSSSKTKGEKKSGTLRPNEKKLDRTDSGSHFDTTSRPHLLVTPSSVIASAITAEDAEIYSQVHPMEFMIRIRWAKSPVIKNSVSFGEEKKEEPSSSPNSPLKRSPSSEKEKPGQFNHIEKLIKRFNHVSKWVITEILTRSHNMDEQKIAIEKFIDIARKCEALNNFNAVLALLSGLSNYMVQRLKTVWSMVNERAVKDFRLLEALMNPARNFANYQKELHRRKFPVLPYVGLFLRTFTFLAESPLYLDQPHNPRVNEDVIKSIGEKMQFVQSTQSQPYSLNMYQSVCDMINKAPIIMEEAQLFELSLQSEPDITTVSVVIADEGSSTGSFSSIEDESELLKTLAENTKGESQPLEVSLGQRRYTISQGDGRFRGSISKTCAYILRIVNAPAIHTPLFSTMETNIFKYFGDVQYSRKDGFLTLSSDRYLIFHARSFSDEFASMVEKLYPEDRKDVDSTFLTRLGYSMGVADANFFRSRMKLHSPAEQLAFGMVHLICQGFTSLTLESMAEGKAFAFKFSLKTKPKTPEPHNLIPSSTYLTGWASESFELPLYSGETVQSDKTKIIISQKENIQKLQKEKTIQTIHATDMAPVRPYAVGKKQENKGIMARVSSKFHKSKSSLFKESDLNGMSEKANDFGEETFPKKLKVEAKLGKIGFEDSQERFVLVRASSLSADFVATIKEKVADENLALLHAAGIASTFSRTTALGDFMHMYAKEEVPTDFLVGNSRRTNEVSFLGQVMMERLMLLPKLFSQKGWGRLNILKESSVEFSKTKKTVQPKIYFELFDSFEAVSWQDLEFDSSTFKASELSKSTSTGSRGGDRLERSASVESKGERSMSIGSKGEEDVLASNTKKHECCFMAAAYISEWSSRCFGGKLICVETSCSVHSGCRFIVSTPAKIVENVVRVLSNEGKSASDVEELIGIKLMNQRTTKTATTHNKS